ncbi:uncharacterized protein B0H18DRAFT_972141 [Fomitopsis serialis]|uniref:uncharacterized protein n=1 Tax=Fomitopsis serialis TaxID=139415 RepID=UPI0020074CE4|nr:uncharacterized protein B0H18DRAFT_972141 [Neoantrodia serialis]KAH9936097.1 hypothetical protein B0H18DRAFT_972141 [Neoantrodia serialis]
MTRPTRIQRFAVDAAIERGQVSHIWVGCPALSSRFHCASLPTSTMIFDAYQANLAVVDRLPPELLIEIFVCCTENLSDGLVPLTLGAVCHYWRDVSLTSPRIWQHLVMSDRRKVEASHAQARLWLVRSWQLPLHVHVNLDSRDFLLPLLSPILPYIHRWRTFDMTMDEANEHFDFAPLVAGASGARLEHLQMIIRGTTGLDPFIEHLQPLERSDIDKPSFAALHSVEPDEPRGIFMRTALTISESVDVLTNASRLLDFLSVLPVLEQFIFYSFPHAGNPEDDIRLAPVVSLPRLRLLELYLEHTNIDFAIQHDHYANVEEDGGSEDEAHDFSQSPWSDRATGMGLRRLIKRSNPPLQVLEMDYADMRTKDFEWCFDRLEHLEEFRIIASDMSNTVINLLAPYEPPQTICRPDGAGRSRPHLRLPKLTMLGLWNCQRLGGDAIVGALCRRVQYTDNLSGDEISKLSDVAIVGCQDFRVQHVLELSPVLGGRLRIS